MFCFALQEFSFAALAEALGSTFSMCGAWFSSSYSYFLGILNSVWWKTMFSSSINDYFFSYITVTKLSSIMFALGWFGFKLLGLQKGAKSFIFLTNVKCSHSGVIFSPLNSFPMTSLILKFFSSKVYASLKIKFQNNVLLNSVKIIHVLAWEHNKTNLIRNIVGIGY